MSTLHSFVSTGARQLSDKEVHDTLPTYDKVLAQIEDIRSQQKSLKCSNGEPVFVQEQTTNNIAILGRRGSGKSSVLKTLYNELIQNKSKCNLLLPPIVPENMENHMTLMACILGLLKPVVENVVKESNHADNLCPHQKSKLEKSYNRLLETYLRLQEPYQKISVQQYSTEAEYLRTMAGVFESSNNLISDFKEFINQLLLEYAENGKTSPPLLFVFIDDIDLSAYRCADLVKTLLTYLAHPAIVTVIAGDLDIFGEALTLNFLRQEGVLEKAAINESYVVETSAQGEERLLARKKKLAYEYLKKVLPPMYRHHAMVWSLENRASFCPRGLLEQADEKNSSVLTLEDQLIRLETYAPELERYFRTVTIDGVTYRPAVLYHIFDDTARGLVNAYSALEQFITEKQKDDNTFCEKILLESMISSNYQLNRYKDLLSLHFIHFGVNAGNSHVYFDNFMDWADKLESELDVLEKFRLFVYLDFAARLLNDTQALETKAYRYVKNDALLLLCSMGKISEKQFELSTDEKVWIELAMGIISKKHFELSENEKARIEAAIRKISEKHFELSENEKARIEAVLKSDALLGVNFQSAKMISMQTLFCLPFSLAVQYAQVEEPRKNINSLSDRYSWKKENIILKVNYSSCFLELLKAYYSSVGDTDNVGCAKEQVKCLQNCPEMLSLIQSLLSQDGKAFIISTMTYPYFFKWSGDVAVLSSLYNRYVVPDGYLIPEEEQVYGSQLAKKLEVPENQRRNYYDFTSHLLKKSYFPDSIAIKENGEAYDETYIEFEKRDFADYGFLTEFLWQHWVSLFYESNSEAAIPFYNYYNNTFCKEIYNDEGELLPLGIYESKPVEQYFLLQEKKNEEVNERDEKHQMKKILLAVDRVGWGKGLGEEEEESESPIIFIKKYIKKQLIKAESNLVRLTENRTYYIDVSCALTATQKFLYAYSGSSDTLATKCQALIQNVLDGSNTSISLTSYIYLRVVLKAFLNTRSWYAKSQARELLNALNDAQWVCKLHGKANKEIQGCYQFWFHCYCRYHQAEMSEGVNAKIAALQEYRTLLESVWKQQDQSSQEVYLDDLKQETKLDQADVEAIPELFK